MVYRSSDYNFDNVIRTDVSRFKLTELPEKGWVKFSHRQKMVSRFLSAVTVCME